MQSANYILLIRPASFGFNTQTAATNAFQHVAALEQETITQKALEEFELFANTLRSNGINILVFDDTKDPVKPDAIFPNNWISFHSNGTIILYPMCAPNRRIERRQDIIDFLRHNFTIHNVVDLSSSEDNGHFLEGTGSIVFDYGNKVAYASLSPRTDKELFLKICIVLNYKPVYFHSYDIAGQEIYHTNVMMCIGEKFSVLCSASISDLAERQTVLDTLKTTGHEIIDISFEQMNSFAGNMLSVLNIDDEQFLILSQTAFMSLTHQQTQALGRYTKLLPISIPTIETIGGGGTRCMMAGIFLPLKD